MMFSEQIDKLVARLTELTVADKVEWKETPNLVTYLASVDKFFVTINKSGSEAYGSLTLQILDRTGRVAEAVIAPNVTRDKAEEFAAWERLWNLYDLARRRAMHSEKVVSDLLASLDKIA